MPGVAVGASVGRAVDSQPGVDSRARIWSAVERLVDRTPDITALRANRLHLLAARRWRQLGRPIPPDLEDAELVNSVATLVAPEVMTLVRRGCEGPVVLHKGPDVAAFYPDAALRPFIDLDVLVPDAARAQASLLESGFVEVGDPTAYVVSPHLLPLEWPGLPLRVEVHDHPNWPRWLDDPPMQEMFDEAVPSVLGVDGVSALAPVHQALAVAAHSWAHGPFSRVGDLVDIAAVTSGLDDEEVRRVARRWGLEQLCRTTTRGADAVLFDAKQPLALRVWARNLVEVRERTVLEIHLGRWFAGFSTTSPRGGFALMWEEVGRDLRPHGEEPWRVKLTRARLAFRNARATKSQHDEAVEKTLRRR